MGIQTIASRWEVLLLRYEKMKMVRKQKKNNENVYTKARIVNVRISFVQFLFCYSFFPSARKIQVLVLHFMMWKFFTLFCACFSLYHRWIVCFTTNGRCSTFSFPVDFGQFWTLSASTFWWLLMCRGPVFLLHRRIQARLNNRKNRVWPSVIKSRVVNVSTISPDDFLVCELSRESMKIFMEDEFLGFFSVSSFIPGVFSVSRLDRSFTRFPRTQWKHWWASRILKVYFYCLLTA